MSAASQPNENADARRQPKVAEPNALTLRTPPVGRRWGLVATGIAGALLAWLLMQQWYPFFLYDMTPTNSASPGPPSDEDIAMVKLYKYRNSIAAAGLAAAVLSVCLACGKAISSRSAAYGLVGAIGGILLGGGFGMLGGWCAQRSFDSPALLYLGDLPRTLAVQVILWGIAAVGIGLAVGLPSWQRQTVFRLFLAAIVGGLLAAIVYPIVWGVAGVFFPAAEGDQLIPAEGSQRLAWLLVAGTCIGAALAWSGSEIPNDSSK